MNTICPAHPTFRSNRHTRRALAKFGILAMAWIATQAGGCPTTVAQWATDAEGILNAINAALAALPASVTVPSNVASAIASLKSLATQVAAATSPTTAQSLGQQLLAAAVTGLPIIASFFGPYGAAAALAIAGVQTLVNAVEADVSTESAVSAPAPLALPGVQAMDLTTARLRYGASVR